MQVSQHAEQENFSIVGGGEARAFQIGQSAHAFKILSDTLYSDKPRAVAREVLCNAVDAHIVSGKTDIPVQVKLTETELIIKDFGPGIPDERIVEIYATYFGSTKQKDDNQTGGFGLGSKSPFAYTDHFMVTSCHAGFRRIYALHIGDDETDGAPAVKPMACAPCGDESGVTVSVPIEAKDRYTFETHIKEVVRDGGMNVTLNGEALATRDYTELRRLGIGLFPNGTANDAYHHQDIKVLYGNVLYVMTDNTAISLLRSKLSKWAIGSYDLILYAPPSTVTITPAREALGYNPRTIATLNRIMGRALHKLNAAIGPAQKRACVETIEKWGMTRANVSLKWSVRHGHEFKTTNYVPHVGAEAIAEFGARKGVESRDLNVEKFLNIASRYFGDKPKLLMGQTEPARDIHGGLRVYGAKVALKERTTARVLGGAMNPFQEQHQYVTRKLLRLVPAELWDKLYYTHNDTGPIRINKTRGRDNRLGDGLKLNIAYSRDAALMSGKRGYFIIDAKITSDQIEAIEAKAPLFRFQIEKIAKIEPIKRTPKPKVEKVKKLFRPVELGSNSKRSRSHGYVRSVAEPKLETPAFYLSWYATRYKELGLAIRTDDGVASLINQIAERYPNAAFAVTETEAKILQEAGARNIDDLLMAELEARIALDDEEDGLCVSVMEEDESFRYYGNTAPRLVRAMMAISPYHGSLALGIPTELGRDERISALWKFASDFFDRKIVSGRNADYSSALSKATEVRVKRYGELKALAIKSIKSKQSAMLARYRKGTLQDKHLPHLELLAKVIDTDMTIYNLSDADKTRLAELLKAEYQRLNPIEEALDDNGDQL